MSKSKKIKINKHAIELSSLDKVYYPKSDITKGEVIDYYKKISKYMLPHLRDRLLVMQRFPDGIGEEGFYHKQIPDYFPGWIGHKTIKLEQGDKQTLVSVDGKEDLIYIADQGTLVFHIWLCRRDKLKHPDKIIFDLDPPGSGKKDFETVKFAARELRKVFKNKGLRPFVMTTGSKGLHVVMPIKPRHNFDTIREFAKKTSKELVEKYPKKFTLETRKNKRKGRLFLDYLRNAYGQTSVAPYSLRAIEGAPVATPLGWNELSSLRSAQKYNMENIFRRLGSKKDPWKDFYKNAKDLKL